jgi:hypothetical protein
MPNPNSQHTFDEYVDIYCEHFARLYGGVTAADVRNGMCDTAELRKSYDAGELANDVAWENYDDACR